MIVVAGGTGTLGKELVPLLKSAGHDVRIVSRSPGPDVEVADVRDPVQVGKALIGAETVVSAITGFGGRDGIDPRSIDRGANLNLIEASRRVGVERFILVSVCQAAPDHPIELFRMKHAAEQALMQSGLRSTIIRPTAYMETWLRILAEPMRRGGKAMVFGRGKNPINFVSARDVARVIERVIADASTDRSVIEVGGPEDLTMKDVIRVFEERTGTHGKVKRVPRPMLRVTSLMMRPINPTLARMAAAAVVMDTRDMSFDPTPLRTRFPDLPFTRLSERVG